MPRTNGSLNWKTMTDALRDLSVVSALWEGWLTAAEQGDQEAQIWVRKAYVERDLFYKRDDGQGSVIGAGR